MRKIKQRLEKLGMTTYRLAQLIGESDQRTQYIVKTKEFGKDHILLCKIAKALDCSIEDLLTDEENEQLKNL